MNKKDIIKVSVCALLPLTLGVGVFVQNNKITNLKTEISKTNVPEKQKVNKVMSQKDVQKYQKDIEDQLNEFIREGVLPKNKKASDFILKVFGLRVDSKISSTELKKYMNKFSYDVEDCFGKYDDTNHNRVEMIVKLSIKQGNNKIETVAPYIKVTLDAKTGEILSGTFYQAESKGL